MNIIYWWLNKGLPETKKVLGKSLKEIISKTDGREVSGTQAEIKGYESCLEIFSCGTNRLKGKIRYADYGIISDSGYPGRFSERKRQ